MKLSQYQWLLFDADETLFDFDAFSGLKHALSQYGVNFTEDDYAEYQKTNKALWDQYQAHEIDTNTLQRQRFHTWSQRLNVPATTLNANFLASMAEICQPLPGAHELLKSITPDVNIGIITNGLTGLQQGRLHNTGFDQYLDLLVISEVVGVGKPSPEIFEYAFERMGHPEKANVLMVGDNLHTDVIGGNRFGIDTCWYNRHQLPNETDIIPTLEVHSHEDFKRWLLS
ncbi:dUMP phosphatase [Parashewanella curva]|uniref:DUMP phosphatase n=1 Tax=Parashewanella curva TaxID=2338552 RepID=A0A3L8PUV9_9GAMM|nr:pyrimidine 5'-nucleotidase [Parashewanella curva]RLV59110.1 dUMP phosphatase [Parashewanella curva]